MQSQEFERIAVIVERGQYRIRRDAHGTEQAGRSYYIPHMRGMDAEEALRLAAQLEQAAADIESGKQHQPDHAYELGVSADPNGRLWAWGRTGPSRRFIPAREYTTDEGLTPEQARALAGKLRAAGARAAP